LFLECAGKGLFRKRVHTKIFDKVIDSDVELVFKVLPKIFRVGALTIFNLFKHKLHVLHVASGPPFVVQQLLAFQVEFDFELLLSLVFDFD
jgi:hypothetical protein